MALLLQFIFSRNESTETANVGLLILPTSHLKSLYFFHDLFTLNIYQVFVQKLIASMIHIMKITDTLFMSHCLFYNAIKSLPFLFCSNMPWAWNLSLVDLHDQKKILTWLFQNYIYCALDSLSWREQFKLANFLIQELENNAIQFNGVILLKVLVVVLSK